MNLFTKAKLSYRALRQNSFLVDELRMDKYNGVLSSIISADPLELIKYRLRTFPKSIHK